MHEVGGAHTWGNMQSGTAVNALLRMSPFGGLSVERPILGGIADMDCIARPDAPCSPASTLGPHRRGARWVCWMVMMVVGQPLQF